MTVWTHLHLCEGSHVLFVEATSFVCATKKTESAYIHMSASAHRAKHKFLPVSAKCTRGKVNNKFLLGKIRTLSYFDEDPTACL